jgi:two-component system sensor histidine kinase KdpD
LLTWLLTTFQNEDSITSDVLSYQLLVVVVALVGGIWPALFAAVLSGITLDYFFVDPLYTVTVNEPLHALALVLYVIIAVLVSIVVDQAARRSRAARRSAAESELVASVAGEVLRGQDALQAFVTRTREAFGLSGVRIVIGDRVIASDGEPASSDEPDVVPVNDEAALELHGRPLQSSDRRLLGVIVAQLASALEHADLEETAREMAPLAAADRVRSALLAAVGHDLRRPLAAATAAVTGLRTRNSNLSARDRDELLDTAETSLKSLTELLTNLLDVSRVQAGALAVTLEPVDIDDLIPSAIEELGIGPDAIDLDIPADLPAVSADRVLLGRVLVNLLSNALKYTPVDQRVVIAASVFQDTVQIRVIDQGPGVPEDRREDIFIPFQRLGDTDNETGLGLGLALSKGFVEGMNGVLEFEETPLGGSTMVVTLRTSPR